MSDTDYKGTFDRAWYLAQYRDVALLEMDPFEHYQWIGRRLGRRPSAQQVDDVAELPHETKTPVNNSNRGNCTNLNAFLSAEPSTPDEPPPPISPLMRYIWRTRKDLQGAFDINQTAGRQQYVEWFNRTVPEEYGIRQIASPASPATSEDGVNLIGYAKSPSGMGEHVRMVATAISAVDIPFFLRDITANGAKDESAFDLLSDKRVFHTNVFHVNADEFPIQVARFGLGHFNIGYWAWELAQCPAAFDTALQLVDEIWGISEFVSDAFRARATVPVYTMPLAVKVPTLAPSECRKARFGLDERPFTFLFTFDAASYLDRKNPIDVVRAFKLAFPRGHEEVQLVFKTHNLGGVIHNTHSKSLWNELLNEIGDSSRIKLINRTLSRNDLLALTAACDAFVSLHRSEGFGRNLAEAMLYGRPVIATNYSGSMEFIRRGSAVPIDYRLVPVNDGSYPHGDDQQWAQPDVEHAAWAMRRLVDDRHWYDDIARAGQTLIRNEYNERVIGCRYSQRLRALRETANAVQVPVAYQNETNRSPVERIKDYLRSKQTVLFTIVSCNYLAYACTVLQSVRQHHPEFGLLICLVDESDELNCVEVDGFHHVQVRDIDLPNFLDMRLRYDVMELNTAVKPYFIDWIYAHTGVDRVIYFDPDLFLYQQLNDVAAAFDQGHSVVLTPHITQPIVDDGCSPTDHSMLQSGVFNLGFIATRRTTETLCFIRWWARQLETGAISDIHNNLFTDQRWCDLAPCFLPNLKILHHPGYNVAYWNLDQRIVERQEDNTVTSNGHPLVFFHFSGFHPRKVRDISKHQTRFTWNNISPTTRELMDAYAETLLNNGYETYIKAPYSYNKIDGLEIRPVMRLAYRDAFPATQSFCSVQEARRRLAELCMEAVDVKPADCGEPFTRLMMLIYRVRPDVRKAYVIETPDGAAGFRAWFSYSILHEYGVELNILGSNRLRHPGAELNTTT